MVAACLWQLSVNTGGLSIEAAHSPWVSVHLSGLFISAAIEPQLSYICLSRLIYYSWSSSLLTYVAGQVL